MRSVGGEGLCVWYCKHGADLSDVGFCYGGYTNCLPWVKVDITWLQLEIE